MAASSKLLVLVEGAASSWSSPRRNASSGTWSTEQGRDPVSLLLLCDPDGLLLLHGLNWAGPDLGAPSPGGGTRMVAKAWRRPWPSTSCLSRPAASTFPRWQRRQHWLLDDGAPPRRQQQLLFLHSNGGMGMDLGAVAAQCRAGIRARQA
jgi:hypothetical protein